MYHEKRYTNKCELKCKQLLIYLFIVELYAFIVINLSLIINQINDLFMGGGVGLSMPTSFLLL